MSNNRADRLRSFIEAIAAEPLQWGKNDCCMFAGRWVEHERKIKLSLPSYSSEAEGRTLAASGLEGIWRGIAEKADLMETYDPQIGDIGLAELSFGVVGVIFCAGGLVALRADKGVTFLRPRHFARVWSV